MGVGGPARVFVWLHRAKDLNRHLSRTIHQRPTGARRELAIRRHDESANQKHSRYELVPTSKWEGKHVPVRVRRTGAPHTPRMGLQIGGNCAKQGGESSKSQAWCYHRTQQVHPWANTRKNGNGFKQTPAREHAQHCSAQPQGKSQPTPIKRQVHTHIVGQFIQ